MQLFLSLTCRVGCTSMQPPPLPPIYHIIYQLPCACQPRVCDVPVPTCAGVQLIMQPNPLDYLTCMQCAPCTHYIFRFWGNAEGEGGQEWEQTDEEFTWTHKLYIFNNEIGFSNKNMDAICKVGGSDKKNQSGYTGERVKMHFGQGLRALRLHGCLGSGIGLFIRWV